MGQGVPGVGAALDLFQVPYQLLQLGQTPAATPSSGTDSGLCAGLSSPDRTIVYRWERESGGPVLGRPQGPRFLLLADHLFCLFPLQPS